MQGGSPSSNWGGEVSEGELDARLEPDAAHLRGTGAELGLAGLAEWAVGALRAALGELDRLPRDDAFWQGWANHNATLNKLSPYCRARLASDPGDGVASGGLRALALRYGPIDFEVSLLARDVAADVSAVVVAVETAEWGSMTTGLDMTEWVLDALADVDLAALTELAKLEWRAEVARRVLEDGVGFEAAVRALAPERIARLD
jgi:hypothetical protein